jgi:hypothetical protein
MTLEEARARSQGKELPEDMDFQDGKMFKKIDKGDILLKEEEEENDEDNEGDIDRARELELLAAKNPEVARFVSLGRFAQVRKIMKYSIHETHTSHVLVYDSLRDHLSLSLSTNNCVSSPSAPACSYNTYDNCSL